MGDAYPVRDTSRPAGAGRGARPAYDLMVAQRRSPEGRTEQIGLVFVTTSAAAAATTALRRLVGDCTPPDCVFLVTDQRQPLPLAARGREYFEELRGRGSRRFRPIQVTIDDYAELNALAAVTGLGRSGDLEIVSPGGGAQPVGERLVMDSYRRLGRYRSAPVLRELLELSGAPGTLETEAVTAPVAD